MQNIMNGRFKALLDPVKDIFQQFLNRINIPLDQVILEMFEEMEVAIYNYE
jgi:hypothetical protein